ncbi:hypothetical protein [Brevundimonas viscosa]|uniref:Uncharacterized protein n=1 Tax=Brevundimonas viscosa TaxID=871741 RepID=A0A1I6SH50_9CAUL|nr:hypothetical protein [Brevundimonas viscosa]SFS76276.1 hypothetical protein SAMN05192570_2414 [Brevundimonas viscosa]
MADNDHPTPAEDPHFETGTVRADRAREQGLGLGARELEAQRDPGGVRIPDVEPGTEDEDSAAADALDRSLGVQGARDDEQAIPPARGAQ